MKRLGIVCILLGIAAATAAGVWYLHNEAEDEQAGMQARQTLERLVDEVNRRAGAEDAPAFSEAEEAGGEMPTLIIDGDAYIGWLSIPELGLELPVLAESRPTSRLKKAPGRYQGSAAEGNLIIAGHNYKHHFTNLRKLSPGSRLSFSDVLGREWAYAVSMAETIGGYDVNGMLAGSDEWDLTLFTCTYTRTSRLTVRCGW